jgi:hypothetical protein
MTDGLDRVTTTLTTGERVLWSGGPDVDVWFSPGDALLIPFSLLWAGFAVYWEFSVLRTGAPGFFALFGGVFVVVGVYIVVLRFFVGPRSMKSTRVDAQTLSSTWTRDRRRITVNFGFPDGVNLRRTFGRTSMSMSAMMGPLTGWDPLQINPVPILFQDVTDVVGLDDALRQLASFSD